MPLIRQKFANVPNDGTVQTGVRLPTDVTWRMLLTDETWTNTLVDGSTQEVGGVAGQVRLQLDANTATAYDEAEFDRMMTWKAT